MNRTTTLRTIAATAACSLAFAACGGSSEADEQRTLTFTILVGERSPIGELWDWWLGEVEERTEGELAFDRYWDSTLMGTTETIQGLNDGRADIGQVEPSNNTGKFPLTSVGELPFETSNAAALAQALGELGRTEGSALAEEWAGHALTPLAWSIGTSSGFATNVPIETAEDLQGLSLRATDRGSRVLESVGANLINVELAEIYGSMERGLIDGIYGIPFGFTGPLKYPEVADHFTDLGLGVSTVHALAMSQDTWASLSSSQQAVIEEVSLEVPAKIAEIERRWEEESCDAVEVAGDTASVLAPEESAKIEAAGKADVFAAWAEEVEAKGGDAEAFYDEYRRALDEAVADHETFQTGVERCAGRG